MKHRAWEIEDAKIVLGELEKRLAALGLHVAMEGRLDRKRDELEIIVYPNVDTAGIEAVHAAFAQGCTCNVVAEDGLSKSPRPMCKALHLRGVTKLKRAQRFGDADLFRAEKWVLSRGKNARLLYVLYHEAPIDMVVPAGEM